MVQANTALWTPEQLVRVKKANKEMFSNEQQQALEELRIDQLNNGEGLVVTEDTRQMLIHQRFPFPTRWLHDKYKVNVDPGAFNIQRSLLKTSTDLSNPFNINDPKYGMKSMMRARGGF